MIQLKSIKVLPPGGFRYTQAETGMQFNESWPFSNQVKAISDHRTGNRLPRPTKPEVAEDLSAYTCQRLGNDPQFCWDSEKKTIQSPNPLAAVADRVGAMLRKYGAQAKQFQATMVDWFGSGQLPVALELSQARADICTGRTTGNPCPNNFLGAWTLAAGAADIIRKQTEIRHKLDLSVEGEESLGTCKTCGCHLKTKIHIPWATIYRNTSDTQFGQFPEFCWMRKEKGA